MTEVETLRVQRNLRERSNVRRLPPPTRYQLVHELKHYEHWLADPAKYVKLGKLEREEFVFKALQVSNHWRLFTDAERIHALEYIEYIRRLYGN